MARPSLGRLRNPRRVTRTRSFPADYLQSVEFLHDSVSLRLQFAIRSTTSVQAQFAAADFRSSQVGSFHEIA